MVDEQHSYTIKDTPKMLRETLLNAMSSLSSTDGRWDEHFSRLQRLVNECNRKRPLGPDGKHGDLHTNECGCEDAPRFCNKHKDRPSVTSVTGSVSPFLPNVTIYLCAECSYKFFPDETHNYSIGPE